MSAQPTAKWIPLIGLGALVLIAKSKKKSPSKKKAKNAAITVHGVTITEEEIFLTDWTDWMNWGPRAVADAHHDGAENADQILAHVMRRAFPDRKWPPGVDDPIVESWRKMVHGLNRTLQSDDEEEAAQ